MKVKKLRVSGRNIIYTIIAKNIVKSFVGVVGSV